jgi:hypothetical protein
LRFWAVLLCRALAPLSALAKLDYMQGNWDFPAIARFLGERFKYWSDDISHEDCFALPGVS